MLLFYYYLPEIDVFDVAMSSDIESECKM